MKVATKSGTGDSFKSFLGLKERQRKAGQVIFSHAGEKSQCNKSYITY